MPRGRIYFCGNYFNRARKVRCEEIFLRIRFKTSLDLMNHINLCYEQLELDININPAPERMDVFEYSEYLTNSDQLQEIICLLESENITGSYFLSTLEKIDPFWN